MNIPLLRKPERSWVKDDKEKGEVLAAHLEQTFQPIGERIMITPLQIKILKQWIPLITPKEVLQTIRAQTKPKKLRALT
jgi:hypothetical protein